MYKRISEIVDNQRQAAPMEAPTRTANLNSFSFLDQRGPRTMNHIKQKNTFKKIEDHN